MALGQAGYGYYATTQLQLLYSPSPVLRCCDIVALGISTHWVYLHTKYIYTSTHLAYLHTKYIYTLDISTYWINIHFYTLDISTLLNTRYIYTLGNIYIMGISTH